MSPLGECVGASSARYQPLLGSEKATTVGPDSERIRWARAGQRDRLGDSEGTLLNSQIHYIELTIILWMDGCPASADRLLRIIVHACHDDRDMGKMSLLRTAPL